ncbi:MAG: polyphenol oxidase family protein, partial [Acidobacteriota bacterium]
MLTVDCFNEIPGVVHAFGQKGLIEREFSKLTPFQGFRIVHLKQIHSDKIQFINSVPGKNLVGDALITSHPGLLLSVKTADCLPVLIAHPGRQVVAAVHCGWRSTAKRLLQKVAEALIGKYGCEPGALRVALGPCIEKECFQVGKDVFNIFQKAGFSREIFEEDSAFSGKWLLDLKKANRILLLETGVLGSRICSLDLCTKCFQSLASYRRDGDRSGRM